MEGFFNKKLFNCGKIVAFWTVDVFGTKVTTLI